MRRPIVILTGPSGAGKSTLLRRATEADPVRVIRLRSVTTRPPRDPVSDASYDFVTRRHFWELIQTAKLAEHDDYNPESPNLYGTSWDEFNRVGPDQVGIKDMTEPGLKQLLDDGRLRIHHVRIKPMNHALRSQDRVQADEERAKLVPNPDYVIVNDHADPDGVEKAFVAFMHLLIHFATEPA